MAAYEKDSYKVLPIALEYIYDLDDEVTETSDYRELLYVLRVAQENDVVRININNYGGHLTTCVAIVNAIKNSAATTIGSLCSIAYSAAGAIWLACDVQEVGRHCGFMGHSAQGGDYGSLQQRKQSVEHTYAILESLYMDVYSGFLSEEEIQSVLKNDEVWLTEKEIIERLNKRNDSEELFDIEMMMEPPPKEILNKITKKDIIRFIHGEIDIDEDGTVMKVEDE